MTSKRGQLVGLIEQGLVSESKVDEALVASGILPDSVAWQHFIVGLLTWIGGLSLAFSALFFIAYNWSDIGRFAKFGLVEALISFSILAYWKMDQQQMTAKVVLFMASILFGVLLALYGQTYQTGADPWQLFFNWALLILPWTLIGRFSALWILWLGLINLSIVLYYMTFRSSIWMLFDSQIGMLWVLFVFNSIALAFWELLAVQWLWLAERWAIRLLASASGAAISLLTLYTIFDSENSHAWVGVIWVAWIAAVYGVYKHYKPDLFMLAGTAFSVIIVVISFLSKHLLKHMDAEGFLFMAFLIISMGTGAAIWLKNIHREWSL